MLYAVFSPNRYNAYAWLNVLGLILFICVGKIEPYTVVFGYFLETLIIGCFTIIKMYLASKYDGSGNSIWFLIPFFMFHYGMFVAIQSVFAFVVIGISGRSFISEPFDLLLNYKTILRLPGMAYVLPLFIGSQFLKLVFDFIIPKKHEQFIASDIMVKPYLRIFIQQFTVILAMFFVVFSNSGVIAALLLIFFRFIIDFLMVAIRENEMLLNKIVDKLYDGKTPKAQIKKQLLLFSE